MRKFQCCRLLCFSASGCHSVVSSVFLPEHTVPSSRKTNTHVKLRAPSSQIMSSSIFTNKLLTMRKFQCCRLLCFSAYGCHSVVSSVFFPPHAVSEMISKLPLQNRFLSFASGSVFSLEHLVSRKNYSSWIWISKNGIYVFTESSILFWDLENVPIPIGTSFLLVVKHIRIALGFYDIHSTPFMHMYAKPFMTKTISFEFAHMRNMKFVPTQRGPNQADNDLIDEIRVWLLSNPPPTVVVLLGGDKIYIQIVEELHRKGHVVVLISDIRSTNLKLKQIVDKFIPWESILQGAVLSRFDPLVVKDSNGNEIIAKEWLKMHGLGDRTLALGLKGHPTYIAMGNDGTIAEFAIDAICTRHKVVVDYYPTENMFKCEKHRHRHFNYLYLSN